MFLNLINYLLCVSAAYIFSLSYIGWFGEYMLWAVILLPPLMTLLSISSMRSLKIICQSPGRITLGEEAELRIIFRNRRLLPVKGCSFVLTIKNLYTGQQQRYPLRYTLLDNCDSYIDLPYDSCGMLHCQLEEVRCYAYLGLISLKSPFHSSSSCLIMPPLISPENMGSIEINRNENLLYRPKPGGGYSEEHELRVYRPGDSMNSIHWKLSSKTDDIIVREAMEPVDNGTVILLHTDSEADLSHLYWLSLRLCSLNISHRINYSKQLSSLISNETDSAYAMRKLLSSLREDFSEVSHTCSRVFIIQDGEVFSA